MVIMMKTTISTFILMLFPIFTFGNEFEEVRVNGQYPAFENSGDQLTLEENFTITYNGHHFLGLRSLVFEFTVSNNGKLQTVVIPTSITNKNRAVIVINQVFLKRNKETSSYTLSVTSVSGDVLNGEKPTVRLRITKPY